jgi:hypothetical protein
VQARRNLIAERDAERQLIACPRWNRRGRDHGEWLLGQPALCLQLLVELQELNPDKVVIAWPEGERFRVTKKAETKQLRLNIKRDKDWFAASGELQIDEGRVMDLREAAGDDGAPRPLRRAGREPVPGADRGTAPPPDGGVGLQRRPR